MQVNINENQSVFCKCLPSWCSLRLVSPEKGVPVWETSILSGHKAIRNAYTRRRVIKMRIQEPIMISSRNLKTTIDAKQGVIQQMGFNTYIISEENRKERWSIYTVMAPTPLHRTTFSLDPASSGQVNPRLQDCSSRWYCDL